MNQYAQLPPRLASNELTTAPDKYGNSLRLQAILYNWPRGLGALSDVGGNAGYFALSLVDAGAADSAVVYDISAEAIALGRSFAERMDLSERVGFVQQAANLAFLESLPPTDTLICLNFLHHAGDKFDIELVAAQGWENYAREWLQLMRSKSRRAIFGIGFENKKPRFWNTQQSSRPLSLASIIKSAGWEIVYDANIYDLKMLGIQAADGRYTSNGQLLIQEPAKTVATRLRKKLSRLTGLNFRPPNPFNKLLRYHLYLLKSSPTS